VEARRLVAGLFIVLVVVSLYALGSLAYYRVYKVKTNSGPHTYTRVEGTYVATGYYEDETWASGEYLIANMAFNTTIYAHFEYSANGGYYYAYYVERLNGFLDYAMWDYEETDVYSATLKAWATVDSKNGPVEAPVTVKLP